VKFNDYDSIYFLGIGGIGMSALARWFRQKGLRVAGYDKTPTPLTHELMEEGMELHFDDKVEFIPGYLSKEKTLVVFTPAIPKDHTEYLYLKDQGFTIMKRSEVLGLISRDYKTVAVAGTHGKTTTSSLIAHIIYTAGQDMVAFLGGITSNYDSNLVMRGDVSKDTVVVAEARRCHLQAGIRPSTTSRAYCVEMSANGLGSRGCSMSQPELLRRGHLGDFPMP
jgi:UDP-N-acetylmuramate--alanine ligase